MNLKGVIFKRKKKREVNPFTQEEVISEEKKGEDESGFTFYLKNTLASLGNKVKGIFHLKKQNKYKVNHLLRAKRIIAGVLFVIYFLAGIMAFPNPFLLISILSCWIFLDYIWKTRGLKWIKD